VAKKEDMWLSWCGKVGSACLLRQVSGSNIKTSLKNTIWATYERRVQDNLARQKNIQKMSARKMYTEANTIPRCGKNKSKNGFILYAASISGFKIQTAQHKYPTVRYTSKLNPRNHEVKENKSLHCHT
jgi:hypothetical protein